MGDMIDLLLGLSLALILVLFLLQTVRLWRRERQLRLLVESLGQQEKLANMGRLLAGIAHELKTPLGAVSCSLDTAKRGLGKIEESLAEIDKSRLDAATLARLDRVEKAMKLVQGNEPVVDQALTRTGQLVRQLRLLGRGDHEPPVPVNVNALIEGTLVLLTHELKHQTTVELQLSEVPPVPGWPGPLGQVFLNLILNAQQAMAGPGKITITSGVEEGQVVVRVKDDGPGLPADVRDKIFMPGWTTKPEDEGSGLGLFISKQIVDRHSGRIEAANAKPKGAVFKVSLPPAATGSPETGV